MDPTATPSTQAPSGTDAPGSTRATRATKDRQFGVRMPAALLAALDARLQSRIEGNPGASINRQGFLIALVERALAEPDALAAGPAVAPVPQAPAAPPAAPEAAVAPKAAPQGGDDVGALLLDLWSFTRRRDGSIPDFEREYAHWVACLRALVGALRAGSDKVTPPPYIYPDGEAEDADPTTPLDLGLALREQFPIPPKPPRKPKPKPAAAPAKAKAKPKAQPKKR